MKTANSQSWHSVNPLLQREMCLSHALFEVAAVLDVATSEIAVGCRRYSRRLHSLCISYFRLKICDRLNDPVEKHHCCHFRGYGLVRMLSNIYSLHVVRMSITLKYYFAEFCRTELVEIKGKDESS